jgi:hypothetical protein
MKVVKIEKVDTLQGELIKLDNTTNIYNRVGEDQWELIYRLKLIKAEAQEKAYQEHKEKI